jgi:hypothetical protein
MKFKQKNNFQRPKNNYSSSTSNYSSSSNSNTLTTFIDEIDLDVLKWTHSIYEPKYPKHYIIKAQSQGTTLEKTLKNCINLGWNGTWKLPFTSPFYVWLLENI